MKKAVLINPNQLNDKIKFVENNIATIKDYINSSANHIIYLKDIQSLSLFKDADITIGQIEHVLRKHGYEIIYQ